MCPVCDGRGWLKAAPIQVVAIWSGTDAEPRHEARADWSDAVAIPCMSCYPAKTNVLV